MSLFKIATVMQPDNAAAQRYLGNSYFKIKSYKDALRAAGTSHNFFQRRSP